MAREENRTKSGLVREAPRFYVGTREARKQADVQGRPLSCPWFVYQVPATCRSRIPRFYVFGDRETSVSVGQAAEGTLSAGAEPIDEEVGVEGEGLGQPLATSPSCSTGRSSTR